MPVINASSYGICIFTSPSVISLPSALVAITPARTIIVILKKNSVAYLKPTVVNKLTSFTRMSAVPPLMVKLWTTVIKTSSPKKAFILFNADTMSVFKRILTISATSATIARYATSFANTASVVSKTIINSFIRGSTFTNFSSFQLKYRRIVQFVQQIFIVGDDYRPSAVFDKLIYKTRNVLPSDVID